MGKKMVGPGMSLIIALAISVNMAQGPDTEISAVNTPTDLDLSGEVIYAVNFGNNGNPTFGDFVFSQDQDYPQLTFTSSAEGQMSMWQAISPNTGYPDLDMLLHGIAWLYAEPSSTISISAGGLLVGARYQLQLIFYADQTRPMDVVVEGRTVLEKHDAYVAQGSVQGKGGSVVKYKFWAGDAILNVSLTTHDGLASGISGLILTQIAGPPFADYGSGTTTELVSGKGIWQIDWGQGPWTWSDNEGEPLLGSNVSGVLALRTTAPAAISADLVATLPIQGELTLTARDQSNADVVIGTMILSGTGVNTVDLDESRLLVDEGSGMCLAPFHPPGPELTMTLDEATGVFAYIQQTEDWRLELAGLYAAPLMKETELQHAILGALGGKVPLIGGLGTFALSGRYDPTERMMPKSFCEYGTAVAASFGAAGGLWEQTWTGGPWAWHDGSPDASAEFLGDSTSGTLETTTTSAPSIDEDMVLRSSFSGRITLTTNNGATREAIDGQIKGDATGTFVADVNAANATFDPSGNIVCAFGVAVSDGPDALITVTEATGEYADIRQAGEWGWYVKGMMTIARVADMSVQQNILAALQKPELLLGAQEEFVLTGWYYREVK